MSWGLRQKVFMDSLRGVTLHSPTLFLLRPFHHHVSHLSPSSLCVPTDSSRVYWTWSLSIPKALPPCIYLSSQPVQLLRVQPAGRHVTPSIFSWGAPKECINARLRAAKRAHPPHEQLFVHSCEESPSRCGVGVPPLQQIFLQPGCIFRHHKKKHE